MKAWLVFTDLPIPSILNGGLHWPYSGGESVRLNLFQYALRYCSDFQVAALVSPRYKNAVSDFAKSVTSDVPLRVLTPFEFLELQLGPNTVLHSLQSDVTRGLYLRAYAARYKWPVVGITHDLSYPHVYTELILAHCGGLGENDAIICCSVAAAQAVQRQVSAVRTLLRPRHASVQLPVIPYGIDAKSVVRFPRFLARTKLGLSPKDFVFLYVGRICGLTKADLTSLVRSFGSIFGGRIDVKLVLAGSTSSKTGQDWYESKLRDLIAKLTLHGQVRLVINPDDEVKTMLYGSADVFVTPACSLQESFGIAVLEAMACGLPVIASDWDGYRDIIVHGETGYLFKTRISDDAISPPSSAFESWPTLLEKIQQAVSLDFGECEEFMLSCEQDRKRTKALGRAGQRRVAQMFDWKIVLRQYQECWSNLIDFAEHKQVETSGVALFPNLPEFFKGHASW